MNAGLSREVVLQELAGAKAIIEHWEGMFQEGVPSVDIPAPDERFLAFVQRFYGEMLLLADKTRSLAIRYGNAEE